MEKIIVDGAHMRCTFATGNAQIRVDSHSLVRIGGALVATEADKAGMKNIPTFGTCKCGWPNRPCVPSPIAWQHVAAQSSVNGAKKLTMQSSAHVPRVAASLFAMLPTTPLWRASETGALLERKRKCETSPRYSEGSFA